jgi:hypothetical protein
MTLNLPPPVIFTHKETLHAIELPPLATFLSTLSIPEHLLKLNDILLRYRTPKSYHRVDVREVSSSELPLSSPEPEEAGSRRGKVEDKGEPVILEEGDTVERYNARRGWTVQGCRGGSSSERTYLAIHAKGGYGSVQWRILDPERSKPHRYTSHINTN